MTITVEDHVAIQRLMYQYARCADRKNYPGLLTCSARMLFSIIPGARSAPLRIFRR